MEAKKFTEKESLELISQMIRNTQQKIETGSGNPFLIWGYASVFFAVLVYVLLLTTNSYTAYMAYMGIPVVGIFGMIFLSRKEQNQKYVATYIDKTITNIWIVFGSVGFVVSLGTFYTLFPILAVLSLLMGMGVTITGLILKMKTVVIAGIIGIIGVIPLLFVEKLAIQNLLFAAIFLLMLVVPGHLLNHKGKRNNV